MKSKGKRIFSHSTTSDIFFSQTEANGEVYAHNNRRRGGDRKGLADSSSVPKLNKRLDSNEEAKYEIAMSNPLKNIDKIEVRRILNRQGINLVDLKESGNNGILPHNGRNKLTFTAVSIDNGSLKQFNQAKQNLQEQGMMLSETRYNYRKFVSDIIPAKTTYNDVPYYAKLYRTKSPYNVIWNDRSGLVNKVSKPTNSYAFN